MTLNPTLQLWPHYEPRVGGAYKPEKCPVCASTRTLVGVRIVRYRAIPRETHWCWPCVFGEHVLWWREPVDAVESGRAL